MAMTERESQQVDPANGSGRTPVVFIHGLWLLPSSWDRWAQLFEDAGSPSAWEAAVSPAELFATAVGPLLPLTFPTRRIGSAPARWRRVPRPRLRPAIE